MFRAWDKSKPPKGPFTLHKDSPSAQGLARCFLFGKNANLSLMWGSVGTEYLTNNGAKLGLSTASGAPSLIFDGTSTATVSNAGLLAAPITYGAKVTPRVINTTNSGIICNGYTANPGNGTSRHQFDVYNGSVRITSVGTVNGASTISGVTAQAEHSILGVIAGTASRTAWLNGIAGTTDTTSVTTYTSTFNQISIGSLFLFDYHTQIFDGSISEACIWNVAVSNEVARYYTDPANRYELWYPLRSRKWFSAGAISHATTGTLSTAGAALSGTSAHIVVHPTSGVLANSGAVVAGSALNYTVHPTSGVLAADGAAIAGSASNYTIHATTSVLATSGAIIAGEALNFSIHATTGILESTGATLSGAALNYSIHTTSGALENAGAAIAGAAERIQGGQPHVTTGALSTGGATIAGTSAHIAIHAPTGTLIGSGSAITGAATRFTVHTTSAALVNFGAELAGSAELIHHTIHATTGALIGSGATLTGRATLGVTNANNLVKWVIASAQPRTIIVTQPSTKIIVSDSGDNITGGN